MDSANEMNREEGLRAFQKGKRSFEEGDYNQALKFFKISQRLYSSKNTEHFISLAEEKLASSNSSSHSSQNHPSHSHSHHSKQGHVEEKQEEKEEEKKYTPEQLVAVNECLKTKDYYQILKVSKDATPEQLKKAYKKLALQLHPDKNKAPRSEEAFKAVSNAFSTLNNEEKRRAYDQLGLDAFEASARGGGGPHGGQFYRSQFDDLSPDELFNIFFGPMGASPFRSAGFGNVHMRRRPFGNSFYYSTGPRRHHSDDETPHNNNRSPLFSLLQFLPLLLFIFLSWTNVRTQTYEPAFSLVEDQLFHIEKKTPNQVPFFVKSDFDANMRGRDLRSFYYEVEQQWIKMQNKVCDPNDDTEESLAACAALRAYKKASRQRQQRAF